MNAVTPIASDCRPECGQPTAQLPDPWPRVGGGGIGGCGGLILRGVVDTQGDLPSTGNNVGDMWMVTQPPPTHLWVWNGVSWVDAGEISAGGGTGTQGPQGPQGPPGQTPTLNVGTVTTGAPGTNAIVTAGGTALARTFNFTIPRGDPGEGVPVGGTAGQVLVKAGTGDFDTEWIDLPEPSPPAVNTDATRPANPEPGQLWFDQTNWRLMMWLGVWFQVGV